MSPELKKIFEAFNDKMCLYPFLGSFYQTFRMSAEPMPNQIRACSLVKSLPENNITNGSILETINSPEWRQLRKDFVDGNFESIKQCQVCIDAECASGSSARIGGSQHFVDHTTVDIVQRIQDIIDNDYMVKELAGIYYFPSGYCNYSCVMCNSEASTSRRTFEVRYLGQNVKPMTANLPEKDFFEILKTVEMINLTGGETLLQPEIHQMIDYLIDNDLAKKISITLLTNVSTYPANLIEKFRQFKNVVYICSIDGVGPVIEYQRRGSVWADVEVNCLRLVHNDFISTVVNHVFSSINALKFMEFADWVYNNCVEFVSLSHVFGCDHIGVGSLPPDLRSVALDRLRQGEQKYINDTTHAARYTLKYIRQAIEMIELTPFDPNLLEKFITQIEVENLVSVQPLHEIVPEWAPYFKVDQ